MENYEESGQLGKGTYGSVVKAKDLRTGKTVALKKSLSVTRDKSIPGSTLREISLLRRFNSDYVCKLEEFFIVYNKDGNPTTVLALEYHDFDLAKFKFEKFGDRKPLPKLFAKHFCYQILLGLQHVHASGVMHRDLKPNNLLIDCKRKRIKIADFGLACPYIPAKSQYSNNMVALWYRAPELLLGSKHYGKSIDVWSVGIIFAEMLLGHVIFTGLTQFEQILHIFNLLGTPSNESWPGVEELENWHHYPKWEGHNLVDVLKDQWKLDENEVDLIAKMLVLNPAKRWTVMQALNHPYFHGIRYNYPEPIGAELIVRENGNKENVDPRTGRSRKRNRE